MLSPSCSWRRAKKNVKFGPDFARQGTVENASLTTHLRAAGAVEVEEPPILVLARAVSPSPATVDEAVLTSCRALSPAAIVEVVMFIALL